MKDKRPWLVGAAALVVLFLTFVALRKKSGPEERSWNGAEETASHYEGTASPLGTTPTPTPSPSASAAPKKLTLAEREELKKKIYGALWVESGKKPSAEEIAHAPPTAAPLSPAYIQQRIREDFKPMAVKCYEDLLAKRPDAGGLAKMEFTIVADEKLGGMVEETKLGEGSTLVDPAFSTCLLESLSTVSFAPPEKGGKTTVHYPITFSPDDEDDASAAGK